MGIGGSSSFITKIETSTIVDIATIGVLAFNAYVIYESLGRGADLRTFGSSTEVLAVQLAGGAIALYALELIYDRVKGGGSSGPLG